jgi:hypothetical protein
VTAFVVAIAAETRRRRAAVVRRNCRRQQTRFWVFEEMMERRKLELVNRARQASRARAK